MGEPAAAWAVIEDGKINVHTVSPTRIAAMVNFLQINRSVAIFVDDTDYMIEVYWVRYANDAVVEKVSIAREAP